MKGAPRFLFNSLVVSCYPSVPLNVIERHSPHEDPIEAPNWPISTSPHFMREKGMSNAFSTTSSPRWPSPQLPNLIDLPVERVQQVTIMTCSPLSQANEAPDSTRSASRAARAETRGASRRREAKHIDIRHAEGGVRLAWQAETISGLKQTTLQMVHPWRSKGQGTSPYQLAARPCRGPLFGQWVEGSLPQGQGTWTLRFLIHIIL